MTLINDQFRAKSKHTTATQRINYRSVTPIILLKYFLSHMLRGILKHSKTSIRHHRLAAVADNLVGKHRYDAISAARGLGSHQVKEILDSIHDLVKGWVALGTMCCMYEAFFSFFGRHAEHLGILRFILNSHTPTGSSRTSWVKSSCSLNYPL